MEWLYNRRARALLYQILMLLAFGLFIFYAGSNLHKNLAQRNIATGYAFMNHEASFEISESLIPYSAADTYARALMVGLLNTLKVSIISIVLAVLLGLFVGVCLLSPNWLLRQTCYGYVNLIRNTPLILQLFFWYSLWTNGLPDSDKAVQFLPNFFLSNRGINFPAIVWDPAYGWSILTLLLAIVAAGVLSHFLNIHQQKTGRLITFWPWALLMIIGAPLVCWGLYGFPMKTHAASLDEFGFQGGARISPEFVALMVGLTIYTSTFIAEIIRSGIVAIPNGQTEAGLSIGLSRGLVLRMVILPQALRVIIPPLINQILNLTKNSTLAIAIGYPDFLSVSNTTLNQTGQAIEAIILIMALYLGLSLLTSFSLNWFNQKMQIKER